MAVIGEDDADALEQASCRIEHVFCDQVLLTMVNVDNKASLVVARIQLRSLEMSDSQQAAVIEHKQLEGMQDAAHAS